MDSNYSLHEDVGLTKRPRPVEVLLHERDGFTSQEPKSGADATTASHRNVGTVSLVCRLCINGVCASSLQINPYELIDISILL